MESFARNSLAQFIQLYSELLDDGSSGGVSDLESKMWAKVTGGASRGNRIPWNIVKKEIKIQLPYLPEIINYTRGCQALKKADGLYIPCGGKCFEEEGVCGNLCQSCAKTGAKYGQLEDRGAPGTYTDPEDKHEITYGTWLAKKEKTIEEVNAAIAEAGFEFTIPTSYLAVNAKRAEAKKRPGRPGVKKAVVESDDDSDSSSISSKSAKSDKPKKAAKKAESDSEEPKKAPKKAKKAESESEDEPKAKKAEPKAKKAESEPKTKKAAKKAEPDSEDEAKPKAKKAEPKTKKAEPKKAKADTDSESESDEPKAKPKAKKADTKVKKPEPEPEPEEGQLAMDAFEEEMTTDLGEEIEIDEKKYILKSERLVFDLQGNWVATIEDGEVTWRE
jgi:hypothetical protein